MTGVVFGLGSGTGAWMPGSTPTGGRMTPRPTWLGGTPDGDGAPGGWPSPGGGPVRSLHAAAV